MNRRLRALLARLGRRAIAIPPIVLGVLAVLAMAAGRQPARRTETEGPAQGVRFIEVQRLPFLPRAVGYGTAQPGATWDAVAQVSGRIAAVHPDLEAGAFITSGTVLLRIEDADYHLAIAQKEASLARIEAQLETLERREANDRESLAIEQRSLELSRKDLERNRTLLEKGTVSRSTVEGIERSVLQQERQVQSLRNALALVPAERRELETQRALNRAQLDAARLDLERTVLRAPFEGRVARVHVEPTQFVGVGTLMATLDGIAVSEVPAQVPLSQMRALLAGHARLTTTGMTLGERLPMFTEMFSAVVRLRISPEDSFQWDAEVTRITDSIDLKTRTGGMIVEVHDSYTEAIPGIRPPLIKGMFCEVEIRGRQRSPELVVPRSALHDGTVYVLDEDDRLIVRSIRAGRSSGDLQLIDEGLEPGERLIVSDVIPPLPGLRLAPTRDRNLEQQLAAEAALEDAAR